LGRFGGRVRRRHKNSNVHKLKFGCFKLIFPEPQGKNHFKQLFLSHFSSLLKVILTILNLFNAFVKKFNQKSFFP